MGKCRSKHFIHMSSDGFNKFVVIKSIIFAQIVQITYQLRVLFFILPSKIYLNVIGHTYNETNVHNFRNFLDFCLKKNYFTAQLQFLSLCSSFNQRWAEPWLFLLSKAKSWLGPRESRALPAVRSWALAPEISWQTNCKFATSEQHCSCSYVYVWSLCLDCCLSFGRFLNISMYRYISLFANCLYVYMYIHV